MNEKLMTQQEVSNMVGMSRSTIWRWTKDGKFPIPIYVGPTKTSIRWKLSEVEEYIENCPRAAN